MKQWCPSDEYNNENPSCYKWLFNTTETNPDAYDCYKSRGAYAGGKKDSASFETLPLAHTDNHLWHHLVMTTKGHGKGMDMYIDGKLEATMPRGLNCENEAMGCVGLNKGMDDPAKYFNAMGAGGEPIDPVGDIRLCGRQIGGSVTNSLSHTGDEDFAQFDPRRYFRGQVAHFALWDSPLSQHQVSALLEEYQHMYLMKSSATYGGTPPSAETWQDTATLAGVLPPLPITCVLPYLRCSLLLTHYVFTAWCRMGFSRGASLQAEDVQPRRPPWPGCRSRRCAGRLLRRGNQRRAQRRARPGFGQAR